MSRNEENESREQGGLESGKKEARVFKKGVGAGKDQRRESGNYETKHHTS